MKNNQRLILLLICTSLLYGIYLAACNDLPENIISLEQSQSASTAIEEPFEAATILPDSATVTQEIETEIPSETSTQTPVAVAPTQTLEEVWQPAQGGPFASFVTADFSGPSICTTCHIGLRDRTGTDVSMPTDWRSSMMANAAVDPVWQAKVSSEVARNPELQAVIEKKCTTCHMPMAETQAVVEGLPVTALGDGFYSTANPLHAAAIDGVSCTLCHQVSDQNLGEMASFSGGYVIDTSTVAPNRLIYGPYQQPVAQQMRNQSGYTPTYGEHMLSAEHCGTCHNLYTPYIDAQGTVLGEFPEQTPYTEWRYSQFGSEAESCQSCHMPVVDGGVVISLRPGRLAPREPFFQHYFVGGNAFMLQILKDWGAELEVTANQSELSTTQSRIVTQVGSQTANLTLLEGSLAGETLTLDFQVEALTGHKFPTSFPSRRAWLHVTVVDAAGQTVFESGKPNPDGTITGNAADFDPTAYEPHYDIISQSDQVQIYEAIMGNTDSEVTYTLLRAAEYLKDNRLLPAGADKDLLPVDIAVYGLAAQDASFVGGSDQVRYEVNLAGAQGPFTVSAELLYETLSYRFVQDLLADATSLTERFGVYYTYADKTPLLAASIPPTQIQ